MVFQNYALWPHMTVARNIALRAPPAQAARPRRSSARLAGGAAQGQPGRASRPRYPGQLSGGQQQRVALARALVLNPDILLLDEPLSNLDAKIRIQVRAEIRRLQQELGITTIYVTHDQEEALSLSDRVAVMRDGRVLQVAPPKELYERPADPLRGRLRRHQQPGRRARCRPGRGERRPGREHRARAAAGGGQRRGGRGAACSRCGRRTWRSGGGGGRGQRGRGARQLRRPTSATRCATTSRREAASCSRWTCATRGTTTRCRWAGRCRSASRLGRAGRARRR